MGAVPYASVVVCTRNRSTTLADACQSILGMDYAPDRWELVIVDNASTDDTVEVARSVRDQCPERVRVIQESTVGLSAARNTGVKATRGDIVAFIDDDAFPQPGWLRAIAEALSLPGVLVAGGPVEPIIEGDLPEWFGETYLPYLTAWDPGPEPLPLTYNEYPRGANIAFKREVFERFGLFSTALGRKGRSLLSCEEIELCLRVERGGGSVRYVPGAGVRHLTVVARIDRRWLAKRFSAQGRSEAVVNRLHGGIIGLAEGLALYARNAKAAWSRRTAGEEAATFSRLQWAALRGYLRGASTVVWKTWKYRPRNGEEARPWSPLDMFR